MLRPELFKTMIAEIRDRLDTLEKLSVEDHVVVTPEKRPERPRLEAFETFWGLYPKKVGKQAAFRAWLTHVRPKGAALEDGVISSLKGQLGQKDWVKDGGQFIPHPQTWLNQHRWLDEVKGGSNDAGKYGRLGETL